MPDVQNEIEFLYHVEKRNWYMLAVDEEIVMEAINEALKSLKHEYNEAEKT